MASNSVDGVLWGDYTYGIETSKKTVAGAKGNSDLDKDAFLKLLMAQLQYQDPLNPMDDKEFVAQMAQFSALEQMQNLNQAYSKSQAYSMIGRTVTGTAYNEGANSYTYVEGRVSSVVMVNGEPNLVIGDGDDAINLQISRVENVYDDYVRLGLMQSINNNVYNSENLMLMGQLVQAITVNDEGKPNGYVEGTVSSIRFGATDTILVVGSREISPREVISVGPAGKIIGEEVHYYMLNDNGEYVWNKGVIENIKISGENMWAVVNGKEIVIDKIDVLSKALNMVGQQVMSSGVASVVNHVRLQGGTIYVYLEDGRQLLVNEVKLV